MARKKPEKTSKPQKIIADTCYLGGRRRGAVLKEEVWSDAGQVVKYSLAYINPRICSQDNGRVLGYDNSHGHHHRHFMGTVEAFEFRGYPKLVDRFKKKLKPYGGRKMPKTAKSKVTNDGVKGFFERAREHARKLDRGEPLAPEIIITFEDASDLLRVLSSKRVRLLSVAKKRPASVSELASGLKRDARAVSRDVDLLESFGLLETRYEANPGHGKRRIVEPRASQYKLVANI